MYFHEYFDDSIFDIEESLVELEEQNNLYTEANTSELLNQGKKLYDKSIGKWAKWYDDKSGRAFINYNNDDKNYQNYTKNGFQYNADQRRWDKGKYQNIKSNIDSDIQNKLRLAEDEYKSRMRQATTREEKREIRKQYENIKNSINYNKSLYNKASNDIKRRGSIFTGKKEQEKEYNQTAAELKNKRDESKAVYRNAVHDYVNRNQAKSDRMMKKDPKTGLSKYDRKAIKMAYKANDQNADEQRMLTQANKAAENGYFGGAYDKKSELKQRFAAQGKLPNHLKSQFF